MGEPETKANAIRVVGGVLRKMVQPAELDAWMKSAPPDVRALIETPPVAVSWLPARVLGETYAGIHQDLFKGADARMVELGRLCMHEDLRGVFKILARLATPEGMAKRAAGMWEHYQRNNGSVSVVRLTDSLLEVRYSGVRSANRAFWLFQHGLMTAATEATGAKTVKVVMRSGTGADAVFLLERGVG